MYTKESLFYWNVWAVSCVHVGRKMCAKACRQDWRDYVHGNFAIELVKATSTAWLCRFVTCFVTVFATVIAITKDLPDIEGDRKYNIDTLATRLGVRTIAFAGKQTPCRIALPCHPFPLSFGMVHWSCC